MEKIVAISEAGVKSKATEMKQYLGANGHDVPQSLCLELVTRLLDEKNWNVLSAKLKKPDSKEARLTSKAAKLENAKLLARRARHQLELLGREDLATYESLVVAFKQDSVEYVVADLRRKLWANGITGDLHLGQYLVVSEAENGYWNQFFGWVHDPESASGFEDSDAAWCTIAALRSVVPEHDAFVVPFAEATPVSEEPIDYEVEVCRIGYGHESIRVATTCELFARYQALDMAGDVSFSEHTSEYEVAGIAK